MDQDQIFTEEAIRDTADHNSAVSNTGEFTAETILIENGLNQQVTLQLQGCREGGSTWFDVGDPFNVPASTNDYETVSDYFPCYRVVASCSVSPTTGDLEIWVIKSKR
jgi:hypothetical protein